MSKQEIVMSAFVMNAVKALEAAIVQEYNNQNTPLSSKLAGSLEGIYRDTERETLSHPHPRKGNALQRLEALQELIEHPTPEILNILNALQHRHNSSVTPTPLKK